MSKERPKRNIIQKKYVSKNTPLPYLLANAIALFKFVRSFRWKCVNFHHGLWRLPSGSLCTICVKYSFKGGDGKLAQRVNNYQPFFSLKRQQCLFSVCVAAFLRHQTCLGYLNIGCFGRLLRSFLADLTRDEVMHRVPWLRDKAMEGLKLKDLAKCFQKRLLFAPRFFLFRAVKTSPSAMARLFRLPFRPMLSILSASNWLPISWIKTHSPTQAYI